MDKENFWLTQIKSFLSIKWAEPKKILIAVITAILFSMVAGVMIWGFDTISTIWVNFFVDLFTK